MDSKKLRLLTISLVLASVMLFASATLYAFYTFQNVGKIKGGLEDPLEAWSETSYIIWQYNSTHYAARNMSTLLVDYIGTDAGPVIQNAQDAILSKSTGKTGILFFKAGQYFVDTKITYNFSQGRIIWQGEGRGKASAATDESTSIFFGTISGGVGLESTRTSWPDLYPDFIMRDLHLNLRGSYWKADYTAIQLEDVSLYLYSDEYGPYSVPYGIIQIGAGPGAHITWKNIYMEIDGLNNPYNVTGITVHYDTFTISNLIVNIPRSDSGDWHTLVSISSTYITNLIKPVFMQGSQNNANITLIEAKNTLNVYGGRLGGEGMGTGTLYGFKRGGGGSGAYLTVNLFGTRIMVEMRDPRLSSSIYIQGWRNPATSSPDTGIPGTLHLAQSGVNVSITSGVSSVTISLEYTEDDTNYGILVTPNWATTIYIQNKTTTQFDVGFGTSAPANAYIDWLVYREGL